MPEDETTPAWLTRQMRSEAASGRLEQGRLHTLYPNGGAHHDANALARVLSLCPDPDVARSTAPTAQEALDALAVLAHLRDWLAGAEPRLVDAARADGATWEQIAPLVGVADRRAAQVRRRRQGPESSETP